MLCVDNYRYISWISNVSGVLQFNITDIKDYRLDRFVGDAYCFNSFSDTDIDFKNQIILTSILVDLRDRAEKNSSVYTRVIFIAKQDRDNSLTGKIYLLDSKRYPKLYKDKKEIDFLKSILLPLDTAQEEYNTPKAYLNITKKIEEFIKINREDYIVKTISFKFKSNGFLLMELEDRGTGKDINDDLSDIKSAYFFIKFLFHKDRFHEQNAENIIPIIDLNEYGANQESLLFVTDEIYKSILRYIAEKRKFEETPITLSELLGVIQYTKSFLLTAMSENILEKSDYKVKIEFLDNIQDSIKSKLKLQPYRPLTLYQFFEDFRLFGFIWVIIFAIYKFYEKSSNFKDDFIYQFLYKYIHNLTPTVTIIILIFITFLFASITQMIYNKNSKKTTFFVLVLWFWHKILHFIKVRSYPNLSKGFFRRRFFPFLINVEMYFRRGFKEDVKAFFIGLLAFIIALFLIFCNLNHLEESIPKTKTPTSPITPIEQNTSSKEANITL